MARDGRGVPFPLCALTIRSMICHCGGESEQCLRCLYKKRKFKIRRSGSAALVSRPPARAGHAHGENDRNNAGRAKTVGTDTFSVCFSFRCTLCLERPCVYLSSPVSPSLLGDSAFWYKRFPTCKR